MAMVSPFYDLHRYPQLDVMVKCNDNLPVLFFSFHDILPTVRDMADSLLFPHELSFAAVDTIP